MMDSFAAAMVMVGRLIYGAMRFLASWLVYGAGDLFWRLVAQHGWFYSVYNRLILWSDDIQGEGSGPWKTIAPKGYRAALKARMNKVDG